MTTTHAETWQDDTPRHPLLSQHDAPPLIETRVSKVMDAPMDKVYAHFWGSEPRLRLELHKDHVKSYHIHHETDDTLEYEFVFEAYGTRNWGKAVEVAHRPHRIDVEVTEGPIAGQSIITLFEEVEGGTKVTQINRVWPGRGSAMVKIMGNKLRSQLSGLAGVHLEQHRVDIETDGRERFQDKFSRARQEAQEQASPVKDFLKTTRAIALPTVILPLVAAAALAWQQGTFSPLALALTLLGGGAALLGANLLNDVYDFYKGADQSARQVPGQIETGSGAFVEGRWSLKRGWATTAALGLVALASGAALALLSTPTVLWYALGGAAIAYFYVGPPFPLAYKGRGLGEALIFTAFGILPVLGGTLSHGGTITGQVWWMGSLFGLTSTLVLYHHHFLHWLGDRAAGKMSPVAAMGPRLGAAVGALLAIATGTVAATATYLGHLPAWGYVAAVTPLVTLRPQIATLRGATETPDMVELAKGGFFAMVLTGIAVLVALWTG